MGCRLHRYRTGDHPAAGGARHASRRQRHALARPPGIEEHERAYGGAAPRHVHSRGAGAGCGGGGGLRAHRPAAGARRSRCRAGAGRVEEPFAMSITSRADAVARDEADKLAAFRERFLLPEGMIYLDGNSLGPLPKATPERVRQVVEEEWGQDLITSWNKHRWIDLPTRIGDKIGRLIGAASGEVV